MESSQNNNKRFTEKNYTKNENITERPLPKKQHDDPEEIFFQRSSNIYNSIPSIADHVEMQSANQTTAIDIESDDSLTCVLNIASTKNERTCYENLSTRECNAINGEVESASAVRVREVKQQIENCYESIIQSFQEKIYSKLEPETYQQLCEDKQNIDPLSADYKELAAWNDKEGHSGDTGTNSLSLSSSEEESEDGHEKKPIRKELLHFKLNENTAAADVEGTGGVEEGFPRGGIIVQIEDIDSSGESESDVEDDHELDHNLLTVPCHDSDENYSSSDQMSTASSCGSEAELDSDAESVEVSSIEGDEMDESIDYDDSSDESPRPDAAGDGDVDGNQKGFDCCEYEVLSPEEMLSQNDFLSPDKVLSPDKEVLSPRYIPNKNQPTNVMEVDFSVQILQTSERSISIPNKKNESVPRDQDYIDIRRIKSNTSEDDEDCIDSYSENSIIISDDEDYVDLNSKNEDEDEAEEIKLSSQAQMVSIQQPACHRAVSISNNSSLHDDLSTLNQCNDKIKNGAVDTGNADFREVSVQQQLSQQRTYSISSESAVSSEVGKHTETICKTRDGSKFLTDENVKIDNSGSNGVVSVQQLSQQRTFCISKNNIFSANTLKTPDSCSKNELTDYSENVKTNNSGSNVSVQNTLYHRSISISNANSIDQLNPGKDQTGEVLNRNYEIEDNEEEDIFEMVSGSDNSVCVQQATYHRSISISNASSIDEFDLEMDQVHEKETNDADTFDYNSHGNSSGNSNVSVQQASSSQRSISVDISRDALNEQYTKRWSMNSLMNIDVLSSQQLDLFATAGNSKKTVSYHTSECSNDNKKTNSFVVVQKPSLNRSMTYSKESRIKVPTVLNGVSFKSDSLESEKEKVTSSHQTLSTDQSTIDDTNGIHRNNEESITVYAENTTVVGPDSKNLTADPISFWSKGTIGNPDSFDSDKSADSTDYGGIQQEFLTQPSVDISSDQNSTSTDSTENLKLKQDVSDESSTSTDSTENIKQKQDVSDVSSCEDLEKNNQQNQNCFQENMNPGQQRTDGSHNSAVNIQQPTFHRSISISNETSNENTSIEKDISDDVESRSSSSHSSVSIQQAAPHRSLTFSIDSGEDNCHGNDDTIAKILENHQGWFDTVCSSKKESNKNLSDENMLTENLQKLSSVSIQNAPNHRSISISQENTVENLDFLQSDRDSQCFEDVSSITNRHSLVIDHKSISALNESMKDDSLDDVDIENSAAAIRHDSICVSRRVSAGDSIAAKKPPSNTAKSNSLKSGTNEIKTNQSGGSESIVTIQHSTPWHRSISVSNQSSINGDTESSVSANSDNLYDKTASDINSTEDIHPSSKCTDSFSSHKLLPDTGSNSSVRSQVSIQHPPGHQQRSISVSYERDDIRQNEQDSLESGGGTAILNAHGNKQQISSVFVQRPSYNKSISISMDTINVKAGGLNDTQIAADARAYDLAENKIEDSIVDESSEHQRRREERQERFNRIRRDISALSGNVDNAMTKTKGISFQRDDSLETSSSVSETLSASKTSSLGSENDISVSIRSDMTNSSSAKDSGSFESSDSFQSTASVILSDDDVKKLEKDSSNESTGGSSKKHRVLFAASNDEVDLSTIKTHEHIGRSILKDDISDSGPSTLNHTTEPEARDVQRNERAERLLRLKKQIESLKGTVNGALDFDISSSDEDLSGEG